MSNTTFDAHKQHLTTEYSDPALLPKRKTTHDSAVESVTQEYPPVPVGALQVHGGVTFRFDGTQWVETSAAETNGQ